MAIKMPEGASVHNPFELRSEFYFRNILRWRKGRSYGIRLLLSKVGRPTNLLVVSMTHSPKDTRWTSLCASLGIPHDDLTSRRGIVESLMKSDLLVLANPGDSRKVTFLSAIDGSGNPGPYFISQMTVSQRKFLGGAIDIAFTANDAELQLLASCSHQDLSVPCDLGGFADALDSLEEGCEDA